MCMCVYIHIYACTYVCSYVCRYVCIHTYVHVCVCVTCTYSCVCMCWCVCIDVYACVCNDMHAFVCIHMSINLLVSFAEYILFYRTLLQKRPIFVYTYVYAMPCMRLCVYTYRSNYWSLLQNTFSFIGLCCKRDLYLCIHMCMQWHACVCVYTYVDKFIGLFCRIHSLL